MDRIAELQELLIGVGVALVCLVAIVRFVSFSWQTAPEEPGHSVTVKPVAVSENASPHVAAIYIAEAAGQPMQRVDEVVAVAGQGLVGDRYYLDRGHWSGSDDYQVTLIASEDLAAIERASGIAVQDGQHRRNIVVRNLPLQHLLGRRFYIGGAFFGYEGPRPPCAYIETVTERGMAKALGRQAGICVRCIHSGTLRQGDAVVISNITLMQALKYRLKRSLRQWQRRNSHHA